MNMLSKLVNQAVKSSQQKGLIQKNRNIYSEENQRNLEEVNWWVNYIFNRHGNKPEISEKAFTKKFVNENKARWYYIASAIKKNPSDFKKSVILDLGNGPCGLLNASEAFTKIGVDPNNFLYKQNKILYNIPKNIIYLTTHAESIPIMDETFDVITCVNVLDHTNEPLSILNEIKRLLKPNGLFFLSVDTRKPAETSIVHPHAINKSQILRWSKPLQVSSYRDDQPCYDEHPTNKRLDIWFTKPS